MDGSSTATVVSRKPRPDRRKRLLDARGSRGGLLRSAEVIQVASLPSGCQRLEGTLESRILPQAVGEFFNNGTSDVFAVRLCKARLSTAMASRT